MFGRFLTSLIFTVDRPAKQAILRKFVKCKQYLKAAIQI